MEPREVKGLEIAAKSRIAKTGEYWLVPSQSSGSKYVVNFKNDEPHCSCPDHETRGCKCKHIFAVEYVIQRELNLDGSVTVTEATRVTEVVKRTTYRQDWPKYNAAQVNEKRKFQVLLRDLCEGIQEPARKGMGRPTIPLRDSIFSAIYKVYSTVSGRRFMSDLTAAHESGFIGRLPCYNSIFKVFESEETTEVLMELIGVTAAPLKPIESSFACDSSGFSGSRFDRWYDHKYGGEKIQRSWVKAHIMCGVKTNVITAVEIHSQNANDAPLLPPLLKTTRKRFDVKEVSADLGYSSERNLQEVEDAGATPYIPFKSNATDSKGGIWARMFHFFSFKREEFLPHYHLRSNVESTFSMVKAKFGDSVRSKLDVAMKNEVLAKIVCHNICCLISAMYELGLDPVFWNEPKEAMMIA
jgi:transposase